MIKTILFSNRIMTQPGDGGGGSLKRIDEDQRKKRADICLTCWLVIYGIFFVVGIIILVSPISSPDPKEYYEYVVAVKAQELRRINQLLAERDALEKLKNQVRSEYSYDDFLRKHRREAR